MIEDIGLLKYSETKLKAYFCEKSFQGWQQPFHLFNRGQALFFLKKKIDSKGYKKMIKVVQDITSTH